MRFAQMLIGVEIPPSLLPDLPERNNIRLVDRRIGVTNEELHSRATQRYIDALSGGPLSTREIADKLHIEQASAYNFLIRNEGREDARVERHGFTKTEGKKQPGIVWRLK